MYVVHNIIPKDMAMYKSLLSCCIAALLAGCSAIPQDIVVKGENTFQIYQVHSAEGATAHRCVFGDITECSGPLVFIEGSVDPGMYDGKKITIVDPVITGSYSFINGLDRRITIPRVGLPALLVSPYSQQKE